MPKEKEIAEASDVGSRELTEDAIRTRAYQLFEQRGCEHGHHLDDWLQAEAELVGKKPIARADESTTRHKVTAA
jgi:Protein of unknown function (DUF2934)